MSRVINRLSGAILIAVVLVLLCAPLNIHQIKAAERQGTGTVTVGNVPPSIISMSISSVGGGANLTAVDPWILYQFNITALDNNLISDIKNVTITLTSSSGQSGLFDKTKSYAFQFDNTTGSKLWKELTATGWSTILTYLDASSAYLIGGTQGRWTFVLKLARTAHYEATWRMGGIVKDSVQTVTKGNGFGVNTYVSLTFPASITWPATAPGLNNQSAILMPADAVVTANYIVRIQVKGFGDLTSGSNTIPLSNVYVGKSTPASNNDGVKLATIYKDLYTGLSSPDGSAYPTYWFVTIPPIQPPGTYMFTYGVNVG